MTEVVEENRSEQHALLSATASEATCLLSDLNNPVVKPTVLDSGATHHMINDKKLIYIEKEDVRFQVTTDNNSNCLEARGMGQDLLRNNSGESILLENALFVAGLNRNLISLTKPFLLTTLRSQETERMQIKLKLLLIMWFLSILI